MFKSAPEHLRLFLIEKREIMFPFYQENYNDFQYDIWAFIEGHKDNMSLNHLKRKVPCWSAEISDDTYGYDCNWKEKINIADWKCWYGGIYIPAHQLSTLTNIQRVVKCA